MTAEHFFASFNTMIERNPFQPFTVELNTGQRHEIDDPKLVVVHKRGIAVMITPGGMPVIFDHESVSEIFGDLKNARPANGASN